MTDSRAYVIAASIVAGSVIVAVGLYAGLRDSARGTATPGSALAAGSATFAEVLARATQDATLALESERPRYVERCWAPAAKRHPGAGPVDFDFEYSFDAAGRQVARAVSDTIPMVPPQDPDFEKLRLSPTGLARTEAHRCLLDIGGPPLTIRPPGRNIDVTVRLRLP